eukprot:symbB.v1.2.013247.t1/scaffold891.1/size154755/15
MNWLIDRFDLDFTAAFVRTKDTTPGMALTYALIQMVEKLAEVSDRARLVTRAEVFQLLLRDKCVVGCEYKKSGRSSKEYGPVVLCTGGYAVRGFGGSSALESVLATCRPDLAHWPTSNSEHCTGDALKLGGQVGAKTIDLEWVHVHPTGLVNEDDPHAQRKVLAGEVFRQAGGLLLDGEGNRFCNELGPAEHIVAEMNKTRGPFRLCLNTAAARELQWQCRTYITRKLMTCYASGADLAKDMRIPLQKLVDIHDAHAEAFRNTLRREELGPYPGTHGRHSWDESSGKTGCGKCDFRNVLVGARVAQEPFHVAVVKPVILYCAGGLEINAQAEVCSSSGEIIPGLYAAGEATGGVHGQCALPGNLLLDCLVFGRLAAKSACRYIFGDDDEFRPCPVQTF